MKTERKLGRPSRCRGCYFEQGYSERCDGTRFRREARAGLGDDEWVYVCLKCGHENPLTVPLSAAHSISEVGMRCSTTCEIEDERIGPVREAR